VHEVPAHAAAAGYVDEWRLSGAGRDEDPLFRSIGKDGKLSGRPMQGGDVLRMIKRRAKVAGLPEAICCHTFRASGITAYLESGGSIEKAQAIAAHESPRTTKLYDRTADRILVEEVDRIRI
jgi:integrase